jgi:hypothetical protein
MNSTNVNRKTLKTRVLSADGSKKVYNYRTSAYKGADGCAVMRVIKTVDPESDFMFLNLIDWTEVNKKADDYGVFATLTYLDEQVLKYANSGKLDHPDVAKLLSYWDKIVKARNVPIKYRPQSPIPGMINVYDMKAYSRDGGANSPLSKYLQAEQEKAYTAGNKELYDELSAFVDLAAGYKVPKKNILKTVVKTVLTGGLGTKQGRAVLSGGLSEKSGRKVIAAVTTGGLSETKTGKKVAAKVEKVASKVDAAAAKVDVKSDELAKKAGQIFKTINLALPRSAFMSMMAINIFGFASHLQTIRESGEKGNAENAKKWKKVRDFWYKIGGSRTKFDKVIKNGSKKKPFLAKAKKKTGVDGSITEELFFKTPDRDGFYSIAPAVLAAWIGIATSVIAAVKSIAGKPAGMDAESEAIIDSDAAAAQAEFDAAAAAEANNTTPEFLRDLTSGGLPMWAWIAIVAGVAGTTYLTVRAIKKSNHGTAAA